MSNPFKYDKPKKEIWADWPIPSTGDYFDYTDYHKACDQYDSRPHFTVSPEPDWEDGKIVYEGKDYKRSYHCDNCDTDCECVLNCKEQVIAIPLPKECEHEPLIDTGVGYHYCPACKQSWKPEQQDIPMDKDGLSDFLDDNLKQSKEDKVSNRMFMAGWISALMHVKVNFADRQSPKEEKE